MYTRLLIQALAEAAPQLGVKHQVFSSDWIQVITTPTDNFYIMGYKWPLNSAGSSHLADDKFGTSVMLKQAGVPCVDHHLFLRRDFTDETGAEIPTLVTELRSAVSTMGYPVVVKNNHGQGGEGVYLIENERQLVSRVTQMFTKYRGVAVSALFDAPYEYRLVVLQGRILLAFKKIRAKIVGDGKRTLAELALAPDGPLATIAENKKESWLLQLEERAHQVVPAGESAPLEWRHNLAFGAQPEVITPDNILYKSLADIALSAAKALNLGFCTVDILQNLSGELKVLEVNSGVSVEKFAEVMGDEGRAIAIDVYTQALKALVKSNT